MSGLIDVLKDAEMKLFAGQVDDTDALRQAIDLGFVTYSYEGASGFMGLPKLRLTDAGRVALSGE